MKLLSELKAWIDDNFHCMTGQPRAYMEIRGVPPDDSMTRLVYDVIGYRMRDKFLDQGSVNRAQEALVQEMFFLFENAKRFFGEDEPQPMLFWRRQLAFRVEAGVARLDCRLVIPGYKFARFVKDSGEYDFPEISECRASQ